MKIRFRKRVHVEIHRWSIDNASNDMKRKKNIGAVPNSLQEITCIINLIISYQTFLGRKHDCIDYCAAAENFRMNKLSLCSKKQIIFILNLNFPQYFHYVKNP